MSLKKIKSIIQTANRDNVSVFIIADNENKAKNKIKEIQKSVFSEFGFHVWDENFEADNFGKQKVLKLVNSYLKKHEQKISSVEVAMQQKHGVSIVYAIAKAYRTKYHDDIYKKIPKKPELSLELMKHRFKKISRQKKSGKPLPIEKVLDTVFNMVPYWG